MAGQMTIGSVRGLNRHSGQRKDPEWLNAQLGKDNARILVMRDMRPVLEVDAENSLHVRWFRLKDFEAAGHPTEGLSFLGVQDGRPLFSLSLRGDEPDSSLSHERFNDRGETDLRSLALAGALSPNELSLLGEARALASWHQANRCCGRCGGRYKVKDGGWRLECRSCSMNAFPRTDPVVIMLITDGDRCLLGREKRFPEGFYSALAGFMEHGEDIEDAVRRETLEETGIEVGDVRYHSSQPWPFPHTLMIGCIGEAATTDIQIDPEEIEEAIWISRDEVRSALTNEHPQGMKIPGPYAIAHHLVKSFVDDGA